MAIKYELINGVLRIDCMNWAIAPSIEDSDAAMAIVIDKLLEAKDATRIVLAEVRENEYNYEQTKMLKEIAAAYNKILNESKLLSVKNIASPNCQKHIPQRLSDLQFLILEILRKDPIGAFVRINATINYIQSSMQLLSPEDKICYQHYLDNALYPMQRLLENTEMMQIAKPNIHKFKFGDRTLYRSIFTPVVRPNFMLTRFMMSTPKLAKLMGKYAIGNTNIEIFKVAGKSRYVYHVTPQEFMLSEEKYTLLDAARRYLESHRPTESEATEPQKVRETFLNIGRDMLRDLSSNMNIALSEKELGELSTILARYTAGYGVLELLLADENIQDIYINAPVGSSPIYINHSDYDECETNLIPTKEDAEAWATRFRLNSGRPLDEANPVLDTELTVTGGRARVAAITRSLSPDGLAYAFRRHREKPWTFPLFMRQKYFTPLYAGLMSFVVDGGRALMIAGGRGSGKTSLLGAIMLEIMKKSRIIVQEDTPEINVELMRQLGYNIMGLKSRSVITHVETELPSDEALRTALRLGDSVLIVGEVRSTESVALFEAMRIGALANVVAGTIHGESAYGVFDRVVNDLGVKPTSFKALDLITICSMMRSPDGLHRFRRVTDVTEVRKHWKEDPAEENGFVPLMQYSAKDDVLKPTDVLLDGESEVLNEIAKRVRDWHGSWDLVWDNILLRAKIKETIVEYAENLNRPGILESDWSTESNEIFHILSDDVRQEVGGLDSKIIYNRWLDWFKQRLKA
ncbi:hypothetical protein EPN87_01070 [archaeon]|nr:MAG: hypothetical protein EPN87_01070 [archaeon]